jgi:hypothetical protein
MDPKPAPSAGVSVSEGEAAERNEDIDAILSNAFDARRRARIEADAMFKLAVEAGADRKIMAGHAHRLANIHLHLTHDAKQLADLAKNAAAQVRANDSGVG